MNMPPSLIGKLVRIPGKIRMRMLKNRVKPKINVPHSSRDKTLFVFIELIVLYRPVFLSPPSHIPGDAVLAKRQFTKYVYV
jgi:hypothetical protein